MKFPKLKYRNLARQLKILLPIFSITFLLIGCMQFMTPKKQVECPIPVQNCTARSWNGLPYDTSSSTVKFLDYYYKFEQLAGTNTPEDEWQLSFFEGNKAFMTFTDGDRQDVMIVSMVGDNSTMINSGIGLPFDGYAGCFTSIGEDVYMGTVADSGYTGNSDLYVAKRQGTMLKDMQRLPDNIHQSEFTWESHPAISPDGKVLFFASDRNDGFGGVDIWYTIRQDGGKWSDPINCGEHINSACEDISPFVSKDGEKLYFSSCGRETVGGYDIFEADIVPEFWQLVKKNDITSLKKTDYFSPAKNLRPPLNTPADEIFPSCPGDCDSIIYYSSNQLGSAGSMVMMQGGFDLFVRRKIIPASLDDSKKRTLAEGTLPELNTDVKPSEGPAPTIKISPTYTVQGKVLNARTSQPVSGANVSVREMPFNVIVKSTQSDDEGNYEVDLDKNKDFEITAHAKDLFFDTFKIKVADDDPVTKVNRDIFVPENLTLRVNFPTDAYLNPYKYTLDSNGIETSQTWQEEMDKLMQNIMLTKDNLSKLILIGHTDDVGSDEYNIKLGQRRVDFIISELVKRGVSAELLEGRSAGENEPLIKRLDENIKMYRKRLRRVELIKVTK